MIDYMYAILVVIAIVRGYQKGFIIALFSMVALIVGLAAALKLSAAVAVYLEQQVTLSSKWLPVISFVLVFLVVVLLVHLGARLLEKTVQLAMLGWANRLGGIALYLVLYTILFSVGLFYADKMSLIEPATLTTAKTYPLIQPLAPTVINGIGYLLPFFSDMFTQLESFFESVSHKIKQ